MGLKRKLSFNAEYAFDSVERGIGKGLMVVSTMYAGEDY